MPSIIIRVQSQNPHPYRALSLSWVGRLGVEQWVEFEVVGAAGFRKPALHGAVLLRTDGVGVYCEVLSGRSRNLRSRIFLDALRMTTFYFWAAGRLEWKWPAFEGRRYNWFQSPKGKSRFLGQTPPSE